jgi:hypothetical protein
MFYGFLISSSSCRAGACRGGAVKALILGDGHLRKDVHMTSEWNTNFGDHIVITRSGGRLCWEVIRSKRGYAALSIANADGFLDL